MKNQIGFIIDQDKCIGCHSCRVACQVQNDTGPEVAWRQVTTWEKGTFPNVIQYNLSLACNHCTDPACMKVCPVEAITKRKKDGVVYINQNLCNGCERCMGACPYGAPKKVPGIRKVSKCDFCMERLDQGKDPRCVETCVGGALQYGQLNEKIQKQGKRRIIKTVEGFADYRLTKPSTRFMENKK